MDIMSYVLAVLSVGFGLITAILYIKGENGKAFVSKMIASTLFVITGIVALSISKVDNIASALIVSGMMMSLWGDYFLAKREMSKLGQLDNFKYGVFAFAISQILFIIGFLKANSFHFSPYFLPLLLLGAIPTLGGKLTKMLTFKDGELALSLVYGVLLSGTLMITCNYYYFMMSTGSLLAMLGAISFVISDFSLGMYYFSSIKSKKLFNISIMIFYFLAEVLYAISLLLG